MKTFASSSSSWNNPSLTDSQWRLLDAVKKNGPITVGVLTDILSRTICGDTMNTLQCKVLELGIGRLRRRKEGRFIFWTFIPNHPTPTP